MDKFFKRYKLPLIQEETWKLKSPMSIGKTEFVTKSFPTKKTSDSYNFSDKFYQTFKEKILQFCEFFSNIDEEIKTSNYFTISLIPDARKSKDFAKSETINQYSSWM